MAKFKVGDRVRYNGEGANAARAGAEAVVYREDGEFIFLRWVRNGLDNQQMDGGYFPRHFEPVAVAPATATLEHRFKVGDIVNNDYHDRTVAKLITRHDRPAVGYTDGGWDYESGIKLVSRDEPAAVAEATTAFDLEFIPFPQVGDAVLIPGFISAINQSPRGTNYNIVFETQNRRVSLHFLEEDFILDEDDDDGDCVCANNDNGPVPKVDTAKAFDALANSIFGLTVRRAA